MEERKFHTLAKFVMEYIFGLSFEAQWKAIKLKKEKKMEGD
jgi:hypothetical protein